MQTGPVQLMVICFPGSAPVPGVVTELHRLRDEKVVGLVDVLFVTKDTAGNVATVDSGQSSTGTSVRSLIGLGTAGDEALRVGVPIGIGQPTGNQPYDHDEVWYATDAIPPGTTAAIALIEHRWLIPLRDAIVRAGGTMVADAWVHPEDLNLISL
jgi:hypothetical protein